eukprot:1157815-Pelagomonas_calceolata.AAC.3
MPLWSLLACCNAASVKGAPLVAWPHASGVASPATAGRGAHMVEQHKLRCLCRHPMASYTAWPHLQVPVSHGAP